MIPLGQQVGNEPILMDSKSTAIAVERSAAPHSVWLPPTQSIDITVWNERLLPVK